MLTFNVILGYQGSSYSETSCEFFFFSFFFQSDRPTQHQETHSTLNEKKWGDGLTSIDPWMFSSSSIVHVWVCPCSSANILQIADVAFRFVFFLFLPCFQLFFCLVLTLETSEMSAIFQVSQPTQLNLVPRSSRLTVH